MMKTSYSMPPGFLLRFFRWYCHPKLVDHIEGDLLEVYGERLKQIGKVKANIKFAVDVLLLFRPGIIRPGKKYTSLNHSDMFANYIKVALRIIRRNKGYSFINISGLAVGLAAAILIMLWVQNEVSFDKFHTKADRIYKMFSRDYYNGSTDVWPNTPSLMGPELKQSYGEVEEFSRFRNVFFLVRTGEHRFNNRGAFADPAFLNMFNFEMLEGNHKALSNDFGIVLSESMAVKLFGKTSCLGETVLVNDGDNFAVTGVLKTLPHNTDFQFEYLLPWNYMTHLGWNRFQDWTQTNANTFVLLKEGTSGEAFQSKVQKIVQHHVQQGDGSTREIIAHPLTKVHLYSQDENGELVRGRIETVRLFSIIAAVIMLIASINFVNLSTARSEKRAQEVGVRKVVGAQRGSLIVQFICESIVLVIFAFVIALVLVQLSLRAFNTIVNTPLQIDFSNPQYWLYALIVIVATGLLAGSYPAFYLSSSRPVQVLKGIFKNMNALITPRKVLVVTQFTFAIVLSICAIMVRQQIQFAMNRDAGYERPGVVYNFLQGEIPAHFESIKNELLSNGAAVSVTRTFSPVTNIWDVSNGYSWQGSTEEDKNSKIFLQFGSDADFVKTFGVTITQGRDIDINTFSSDTAAVLLNESAVEIMRMKNPVGEVIKNESGEVLHVVGVVKDFIVGSPYQKVGPMMIKGWRNRYGSLHFRLNPELSQADALQKAETVFKKYNPEYPFEYFFAEDYYNMKFGNEKQTGTLASLFAGLAIFISCLGLFGLAAYVAENRTKEIGIRKVLGASTPGIIAMISKDFIRLVLVAIVISVPISFYIVNNWLQSFNYRVPIGVSVFLITAITAVLISLMTVGLQAVRAAVANPVKSLRSE
ncbi:MAG TPA: ABC transporter permease [Cyclobacteriaceae bacterium]|nr:ABC transporter permease [Cyclobacteriaceae bacterium]